MDRLVQHCLNRWILIWQQTPEELSCKFFLLSSKNVCGTKQRAFDQIVHDVCLQELDVTFAMDRAGLVGDDGPTHHGAFDIAYLRALPNITLMAPRDGPVLTTRRYAMANFSNAAWESEETARYVAELGKDVENAQAQVDQLEHQTEP